MSFNLNFNNNKPAITSAQASQDGGAGNLGYMKGGGNSKNRKEQSSNSIFEDSKPDSFTKSGLEKEQTPFLEKFLLWLKLFFQKFLKP
ncbi:hypothetical protein IJV79_01420 [bacterium]|nr:hypothetical protein [bacterium]